MEHDEKRELDYLFTLAHDFAGQHPQFDDNFILSLHEKYTAQGHLSMAQEQALKRIMHQWHMVEWEEGFYG